MKKKILKRSGLGLLIGAAAFIIIILIFNRAGDGTVHFYSDRFLSRIGSGAGAVALQVLACGLYGAFCMSGTLFYEIEKLPLTLATCLHYLLIAGLYAPLAVVLDWGMPVGTFLLIEVIMTAGFFLIWLIMYLSYKAQTRKLNELTETNKLQQKRTF